MKHKGFGLILVLIFTAIALAVVSSISLAMVSDIRLNRQSKNSATAYSMARSAIGDAIFALKLSNKEKPIVPTDSGPTQSCKPSSGDYNYSIDGVSYSKKTLSDLSSMSAGNYYAYQLCVDGANDYILGIGYAGGQKITLKAQIIHNDTSVTDLSGVTTWDHTKDYFKVYQAGS